MELSYLLAPATVLLLCMLELNRSQGKCILGKNGGYCSQIRIVSFDNQDSTPDEDLLNGVDYITEIRKDSETLYNRLNYQYKYTKNN